MLSQKEIKVMRTISYNKDGMSFSVIVYSQYSCQVQDDVTECKNTGCYG
jgi:hypothetical protein